MTREKITDHDEPEENEMTTMTRTRTCWTCETTKSDEWWSYQVDGVTYTACTPCAIKGDEMHLGDDARTHDITTHTLLTDEPEPTGTRCTACGEEIDPSEIHYLIADANWERHHKACRDCADTLRNGGWSECDPT